MLNFENTQSIKRSAKVFAQPSPIALSWCTTLYLKDTRVLGPGDEFGIPLCSDRKPHDPLTDFGEYAKTAPVEFRNESNVDTKIKPLAVREERTDGKAELLSITRQDWEATLQCSRYTLGIGIRGKITAQRNRIATVVKVNCA